MQILFKFHKGIDHSAGKNNNNARTFVAGTLCSN